MRCPRICFVNNQVLFPLIIKTKEELRKHYQAFQTMCLTSDLQAIEENVAQYDINVVKRWKSLEKVKGAW
jgi:hypothetical protein